MLAHMNKVTRGEYFWKRGHVTFWLTGGGSQSRYILCLSGSIVSLLNVKVLI